MAAADVSGGRPVRRPRSAAYLQIALTVGVAVLLAAITLTTRQPPPPAIAEFAPQAAEQIKEQPKEQSSQFGSGAGPGDCPPGAECEAGEGEGVGAGGGTTSTLAASTIAPAVVGPATVKRCVGNPPRQIEDPQSPPCIAYWDDSKGNGGATATGVTKDDIIIAAPNRGTPDLYQPLENFFNSRFQLYGRRIKVVTTSNGGTAAADEVKQAGAFAALTKYSDAPFYRQLAKHKIIGTYRTPDFSDTELAEAAPYLWGYPMSFTQMLANIGDWTCRRLVGQSAAHAGENDGQPLSASPRKFAIYMDIATQDSTLRPDVLKSAIQQCGGTVEFDTVFNRFDNDLVRFRTQIAANKASGVTTVFCLCVSTSLVSLQSVSSAQRYEPEWIISSYPQLVQGDGYTGSQMNRTFGVSFGPMDRVPEDHPQIWAVREGDPTNPNGQFREGIIGSNDIHYRGFLLIASGIQMAGPNLTPQTFMEGLRRTRFPNPDHPIMAGTVGFEGDFSMTNDAAEFWFSETDSGPYSDNQSGPTFCWVDGGRRHAKGTWPKGGDPFFQGPCDSGNRSVS